MLLLYQRCLYSPLLGLGRYDSLDGGSARRQAATYTGQHEQNKRTQTFVRRI
jgi:hypothetical protein